ncbi:MAG: 2,3-bisphosphoglycerate-independent phosphoglycerate mutase [Puniceicoccaceae bacterium]
MSPNPELLRKLSSDEGGKIVFLVIDGLGGLPDASGETPLDQADTPNLDDLANGGISGLHEPVGPGITPGSGPGHLSLFGYDPLEYDIGRGVLSALGVDYPLSAGDLAARGNFCTLADDGTVKDRRAGRISTEKCRELCDKLNEINLPGGAFDIKPVKEHRFLFVLKDVDTTVRLNDTDPHTTGLSPRSPEPEDGDDERAAETARMVRAFIKKAEDRLREEADANGILLRGFGALPEIPRLPDFTRMRCKAVAAYPMYRGVSRLLGMEVLEAEDSLENELEHLRGAWDSGDFFFVHIKKTDSHGEDGDFRAKQELIQTIDRWLPGLTELDPDVLVVTGDHSTPAALRAHSWHPVPVLLHAPLTVRRDPVMRFSETAALQGALGARFPATELMPLAMAHARRLQKFGA